MIVRIAGYILNEKKELYIGLTAIYGIGQYIARKICINLNMSPTKRVKDLSVDEITQLNSNIRDNYIIGDDLVKEIIANKRRYISINCYRGKRLRNGLPCNGQKTRSNARTAKKLFKKI